MRQSPARYQRERRRFVCPRWRGARTSGRFGRDDICGTIPDSLLALTTPRQLHPGIKPLFLKSRRLPDRGQAPFTRQRNDEFVFHIIPATDHSYDPSCTFLKRSVCSQNIGIDWVTIGRHCTWDIAVVDRIDDVGFSWVSGAHWPVNDDIDHSSNPVF